MIIRTLAATAVLTTALVGGIAMPASADTTDSCLGERIVAIWRQLPPNLQSDLKDLATMTPSERAEAAREIRQGARSGEYGSEVAEDAASRQARRLATWVSLPADLRSDLVDVRLAAPGERRDLVREIADTALAGGYGEKTQTVAENIQENLCRTP